ncbi:MAG: HD domain-containing protein [Sandaracinaceae bacterium]
MILRDPVHGLVAFEGAAQPVAAALLATPEVQRLRRVRQLGLTSLVFPGAEHSRFAHAVGTAHVMIRLQDRVRAQADRLPPDHRMDPSAARDALAAALLHDLGHGPFSHLFEDVLPHARPHEEWTRALLLDPGTGVHRALAALEGGLPERVAALVSGRHRLPWLGRTVSGTLDVDRSDYLLRDSLMTGVAYGLYDLDWLLRALTFVRTDDDRWVLAVQGRKGLPPIEGFFLGRHYMFQQVYHHKATRAAECLIRAAFQRLAELIRDGSAPERTPAAVRAAVLGEPMSTGTYLELDDPLLHGCFAAWAQGTDPVLAGLAARIRHRRLPKTIPLPEDRPQLWEEARSRAVGIARAHGFRPELNVFLDVAKDRPFVEGEGDDVLFVTLSHQPLRRLGDVSFVLRQLRNQTLVRPRLVFPAEIRDEVEAAVEEVLR